MNVSADPTRTGRVGKGQPFRSMPAVVIALLAVVMTAASARAATQASGAKASSTATVAPTTVLAMAMAPVAATVVVEEVDPVTPNASFTYSVYCYSSGCSAFYTVYSGYVTFGVFCSGWGWVHGSWVGAGSWSTWITCGSYRPPLTWRFRYVG